MRSRLQETLDRISQRAASSIVGRGRLEPLGLNRALLRRLAAEPGAKDGLLADPVFEMARVWKPADRTLGELEGNLLHPSVVTALDGATTERMPRERHPYIHQVEAWQVSRAGKSCLVTSGTGSGKTECFMVPMLDDLVRQACGSKISGVRGIIIYPLNALIESQRERLAAWTDGLKGKVSFALYNGLTPEEPRQIRGPLAAAELGDRRTIRHTPPSILVTNVTMLEYLLLRSQDLPILEKSQGMLRWIVLDEAHGYVGAQAAEMALLLRRVRAAFGVEPEDVRLMATSATISEGPQTREKLTRFVADLAGVNEGGVAVIEGKEVTPALPALGADAPLDADHLGSLDPAGLWHALAPHPRIRAVRDVLQRRPARLAEIGGLLTGPGGRITRFIGQDLLDSVARAVDPETGQRLIPWRAHLFHRSQGGFWVCVDPECPHRDPELAEAGPSWGFGALWLEQRDRCDCGAQVFELVACTECGTGHLVAGAEIGASMRLVARQLVDFDDFLIDYEPEPEPDRGEPTRQGTDAPPAPATVVTIWIRPGSGSPNEEHLRLEDGCLFQNGPPPDGRSVPVRVIHDEQDRACCGRAQDASLMPQRYGPPFLMGSAIPLALEEMAKPVDAPGLPLGGRRIITFSDSRQGTARLAARLQQEAERQLTRAYLYHLVQKETGPSAAERELLERKLALLIGFGDDFADDIREIKGKLAGGAAPVRWPELVNGLARHTELRNFAKKVWETRGWRGDDLAKEPERLAEMFLYRELLRRPRVQNNAETMGLVRLFFPDLDVRARVAVPAPLKEAGVDAEGWAGLLHAAVDLGFRENLAVRVSPEWIMRWASPHGSGSNSMIASGTPPDQRPPGSRPWPSVTVSSLSRLAQLIYRMIGADPGLKADEDRAREVMDAAWGLITSTICASAGQGAWQIDFGKAAVVRVEAGWLCPVTRRVLGYSTGGPSPYGSQDPRLLLPIRMPRMPHADPAGLSRPEREAILEWLRTNREVADLRDRALWTDLHDRIAAFDPFFLAQEHSAQIPRPVLQVYEERYKKGEINVLNCSTTMEMGVDIPNVGLVVNANLPPAISNYRQRVGRAGRRGEEWAFGLTFCRDLPLDRMAFANPVSFLQAPIAAPAVRLDSATIVMRHVNAALLAAHLRNLGGVNISGSCREFFGAQEDPAAPFADGSRADNFILDLHGPMPDDAHLGKDLERLTRGTILKDRSPSSLCAETAQTFEELLRRWQREYRELIAAAAVPGIDKEVMQSYRLRAKRMAGEFLIGELARRGFTPAYGFPVDVVSFDHLSGKPDGNDPVLAFGERRGGASRPLDVAVREYAPGAEIVLDGLVHASEGVQPAWSASADSSGLEDLQTFWECRRCRAFGIVRTDLSECPSCQGPDPQLTRMLRPAGFLGRRTPHTGYERLAHVPFEAPRISAAGGGWLALPDPGIGRMRGDPGGTVITMSSGARQGGYALCLCCGRAESEASRQWGEPMSAAMRRHKPLAPVRGIPLIDGYCPGGLRDVNRVQRHLRLGHEARTDVFEFQCGPGVSRGAALGLAAGLREALAERLGVEAREIRVSTAATKGPSGDDRISVLLFDKTSGGAGFATRLAEIEWFEAAVTSAAGHLDCPQECEAGCPACVLRPDLNIGDVRIDRPAALTLAQTVRDRLSLPEELKLFGKETRMVGSPLPDFLDLRRARSKLRRLALFLQGEPASWDLSGWAIEKILPRFAESGIEMMLYVQASHLAAGALKTAQKLDLYRLAAKGNAKLASLASLPVTSTGYALLAVAETEGGIRSFATTDATAVLPGPDWGSGAITPVVRGPGVLPTEAEDVDPEKLLIMETGNSHLVWFRKQADGPAHGFGRRFWHTLAQEAPDFIARLKREEIEEASYSDRYLQTPLAIRLLAEVLTEMPGRSAATRVRVRSAANTGQRIQSWAIHHAFGEDGIRKSVIAETLGCDDVVIQDRQRLPHARSFTLRLKSEATVSILLDQGFGAWRSAEDAQHNFRASPKQQATAIKALKMSIYMEHVRGSPVVLEKG